MPIRKPPAAPATPAQPRKPSTDPRSRTIAGKDNPRLQADLRWQRTKRYGWNSR
ncbi:MAG TPA: hypothetical protein PKD04_02080 [Rhodocyclaceae bacterium]|jgi:hypothetical protein|nr:hypothetical protein [Betaproteobacteria bacterium]HMU99839.1 hypothetical protein [Rhodocyclaceae bacterium]HMV20056.1 hypothetical protein [Rhodocyclaceae bacterium]HNE43684.1 hypothetical protein [Rhodocyclaceae bacterium]HNL21822.1 hypothetical protein [Rhodocyclaceae bacterium]